MAAWHIWPQFHVKFFDRRELYLERAVKLLMVFWHCGYCFHKVSEFFFYLFEFPLTNMAKATYQKAMQ